MTQRNPNPNPRLKTTPSEPCSNNSYTLQQSAIEANTKSFRFDHSELELINKSYQRNKVARPTRQLKTTIVESLSEKNLGEQKKEMTLMNKYYYSTVNLEAIEGKSESEDVVGLLREKCGKYERTIGELYEKEEEQTKQLKEAKEEVSRLKVLYQSKLGEVSSVSYQITSRIQKEQAEKNLFIKEINNRNIEINRLRESSAVLKAENQTLNIVLKEKQAQIQQLEQSLQDADEHRRKLESYQLAVSGSNNLLKDIEEQAQQLEREAIVKDRMIEELQTKVNGFFEKNKTYQQKILELEQAANASQNQQGKWKQTLSYAQAQAQQWKQCYIDASRQLQQLPQLQIKLKNTLLTNEDLQSRIKDLTQTQQQLKLQLNTQNVRQKRLLELQSTIQTLQRNLKDKQEQLMGAQDQVGKLVWELREANNQQEKITELEKTVDEQTREIKGLERKIEEKTIISNSYEREVKRITEENQKIKEKNQKIDHVFKENKRLTGALMEKINEIERLQHTVNTLQSRVATLSNEVLKLNALYQQSNDSNAELTSSYQTIQMKLQCQLSLKVQLQERVDRLASESSSLSKSLSKEREITRITSIERENLRRDLCDLQNQLETEISSHDRYRSQCQTQISQQRRRVQELTNEIGGIKKRIQQMQRKEKEQSESIQVLESDKRSMLAEFSVLRTSYEQAVTRLNVFDKWKSGYLSFMGSVNKVNHQMRQTSEQLLA